MQFRERANIVSIVYSQDTSLEHLPDQRFVGKSTDRP